VALSQSETGLFMAALALFFGPFAVLKSAFQAQFIRTARPDDKDIARQKPK
jgi:hypothetical protein